MALACPCVGVGLGGILLTHPMSFLMDTHAPCICYAHTVKTWLTAWWVWSGVVCTLCVSIDWVI